MQFITRGDITLHAFYQPNPGKPVLVFLNSLGTDFRIWQQVILGLNGQFSYLCYDKRGHGLSDTGTSPYSIAELAQDVVGLLDFYAVPQAILCGVSVGGMIAQQVTIARPDRVNGLMLYDTAHKIGTLESWQTRIDAIAKDGIEPLAEPILERWFSTGYRRDRPGDLAGWRNMLVRTPVDGYLGTCAALRDADLTEAVGGITIPTLCVVGDQDGATPPALVRGLAERIPGARYQEIPGVGHLPCIETPELVAQQIHHFAAEIPHV